MKKTNTLTVICAAVIASTCFAANASSATNTMPAVSTKAAVSTPSTTTTTTAPVTPVGTLPHTGYGTTFLVWLGVAAGLVGLILLLATAILRRRNDAA